MQLGPWFPWRSSGFYLELVKVASNRPVQKLFPKRSRLKSGQVQCLLCCHRQDYCTYCSCFICLLDDNHWLAADLCHYGSYWRGNRHFILAFIKLPQTDAPETNPSQRAQKGSFAQLFKTPLMLNLFIAYFSLYAVNWGLVTWIPTYLVDVRD